MHKCFEYRELMLDPYAEDIVINNVIYPGSEVEMLNTMNSMGQKGWEVISVSQPIKYSESERSYCIVVFKREIINQ